MTLAISASNIFLAEELSPVREIRRKLPSEQDQNIITEEAQQAVELDVKVQNTIDAIDRLIAAREAQGDSASGQELTEEEKKVVEDLKETDQKVRQHEQAHKTVGGAYAGAIQYETVTGPDGKQYAVGGEVAIDASPIPGNPRATIAKLDIVIRAALAPAEPSPQDFAVARQAQAARSQAQKELRELEESEAQNGDNPFTVVQPDLNDPESVQKTESNPAFDLRFVEAAVNLIRASNL